MQRDCVVFHPAWLLQTTLLPPLTSLVFPTAVRGEIERGEMQKMAILIVYRLESLVEELGRKTRKDVV